MSEFRPATVGVVCYGNILRSQVLASYLRAGITAQNCKYEVFDAGVCEHPEIEFRDARQTLDEVEERLQERGLTLRLYQKTWSTQVAFQLLNCALILAADLQVRDILNQRLPAAHPPIYGFYELLGEGEREFQDTYDYERQAQHKETFDKSFDELERLAARLSLTLPGNLCGDTPATVIDLKHSS